MESGVNLAQIGTKHGINIFMIPNFYIKTEKLSIVKKINVPVTMKFGDWLLKQRCEDVWAKKINRS